MEPGNDKKLLARLEKSLELLEASEMEEALEILKLCEESLSTVLDPDIHMLIFHNLAMCYQLLQDFEECAGYLEKTIKVAKSRETSEDTERIRNIRYLCMLYIQLGAIISHIGNHPTAVSHAKQAFNYASQALQLCTSLAISKDLSSYTFQNSKTLESILHYLSGKLLKFPPNCNKIIQRSSLGVLHYTDWIFSFTINDILDIKPLKYFEVKNSHLFMAELSKDFMLEKVCLVLSSCYLVATETRLLSDPNEIKKAKGWHQKAVEIGTALIPIETPLLQHIRTSYNKHYPMKVPRIVKASKSKTPIKDRGVSSSKNKTPLRPKAGMQRKVIKNIEIKTDRAGGKEKELIFNKKPLEVYPKARTQREDNQEPEPPISEDFNQESPNNTLIINSNDLYGEYSDD